MHHSHMNAGAALVLAYAKYEKRLTRFGNIFGWAFLLLLIGWMAQNIGMPSISIWDAPVREMVTIGYNDRDWTRGQSIPVGVAQRTQAQ